MGGKEGRGGSEGREGRREKGRERCDQHAHARTKRWLHSLTEGSVSLYRALAQQRQVSART